MADVQTCPNCGAEIPADAPAGLCPKCLLREGFNSGEPSALAEAAATQSHAGAPTPGFIPPLPSELAPQFPQLEILELLGHGGMGAVYKARQPGLDRIVALKILPPRAGQDPAFAERFVREARAMARLSHPRITNVYDFGQTGGLFFLVMEFIDGVNLRQAIRAGTVTPKVALEIVTQVCDALQYAHDEGVVHRDIKPENILLDRRGRVKIADFGLAKLLGAGGAEAELTGTHQVMGTLRYMAPEQMEGSRNVDHRADIYSLGVVFYELLTGEVPMGRFQPPSEKVQVDVRIDEVVLKSLEREPERRYQHASEMKSDVELGSVPAAGAVAAPVEPGAPAPRDDASPAPSNIPTIANFGLLVVIYFAGVVGIGFLWQYRNEHLMLLGWLGLAAIALSLVQWQSSKGGDSSDQPSGDPLSLFAAAIIAAALLKSSATAGIEAAKAAGLEGEPGGFWTGIWLPALVFFGAFVFPSVWRRQVLNRNGRRRPATAFDWRRLPLLAIGLLIIAAGLAGVFNHLLIAIDSVFWHPHDVAAADFEQKYLGNEDQLLNQLPQSDRDSGQARLVFDSTVDFLANEFVVSGIRSGHWGMSEWSYLLFGALIFFGVIAIGIDSSQNESSDPLLTLTSAAMTIGLPFAAALGVLAFYTAGMQTPIRERFREQGLYQTIHCDGKAADFATMIGVRLSKDGFTPDSNWGYRFQAADSESAVAEFRYALFEPKTLFERWSFTAGGIVRRQPLIVVTQLSGLRSQRNVVTIDARADSGRFNERKWTALVDDLEEAINEVARKNAEAQAPAGEQEGRDEPAAPDVAAQRPG